MNLESRALALAFDCFGLYGRKYENEAGGSWGGGKGREMLAQEKQTKVPAADTALVTLG